MLAAVTQRHAASGSTGTLSPSRSTSRAVCPATTSSGCPTPPCASRGSGCAPRSCRRSSTWPPNRRHGQPGARRSAQDGRRLRARGRARACWSPTDAPPRRRARRRRRAGRARARRLGAAGARCARAGRRAPRAAASSRSSSRRRTRTRRLWSTGVGVRSRVPRRAAPVPEGRGRVAGPAARSRRRRRRGRRLDDEPLDLAEVRGLATARRALEVGGGRWPPPPAHRSARGRQDDARPPAGDDPPAPRPTTKRSRSPGSTRRPGRIRDGHLVRRRPFRAPHHTASVAALVGGGSGRPRPGEVHDGASRHAVPRRARRVPAASRSTRCANRSRSGSCASPRQAISLALPRRLPADRVLEPVPVRARRAPLRVQRRATGALPPPPVGAAPRPLRPPPRGAPPPEPGDGRARRRRRCGPGSRSPSIANECATDPRAVAHATRTSPPVRWRRSCRCDRRGRRRVALGRSPSAP